MLSRESDTEQGPILLMSISRSPNLTRCVRSQALAIGKVPSRLVTACSKHLVTQAVV
jgi:hypothetical protein